MRYYLVALFEKDYTNSIEKMKKDLCKKYRYANEVPVLHLTIDTFNDIEVEKLWVPIETSLKAYKKFKVKISKTPIMESSKKVVSLKIQNEGYIVKMSRKINSEMRKSGVILKDFSPDPQMFLPLMTTTSSFKDFPIAEDPDDFIISKIDRIELWKALSRNNVMIKSYTLRDY